MPRYRQKIDTSQPEIVETLRAGGATVTSMGQPLDLLVGYQGQTDIVEAKTLKKGFKRKQVDFIRAWRGRPALLMQSADDALAYLRGERERLIPTDEQLARIRD